MPLRDLKRGKRKHAEGKREGGKKKPQNRTNLGLSVKVVKAKKRNC